MVFFCEKFFEYFPLSSLSCPSYKRWFYLSAYMIWENLNIQLRIINFYKNLLENASRIITGIYILSYFFVVAAQS